MPLRRGRETARHRQVLPAEPYYVPGPAVIRSEVLFHTRAGQSAYRVTNRALAPPTATPPSMAIRVARLGQITPLAGLRGNYAEHLALLLADQLMEGHMLLVARQGGLDCPAARHSPASPGTWNWALTAPSRRNASMQRRT